MDIEEINKEIVKSRIDNIIENIISERENANLYKNSYGDITLFYAKSLVNMLELYIKMGSE